MRTRILLAMLGIVSFIAFSQVFAAPPTLIATFEITGSGSLFHFETVTPGVKPFVSKISAAQIAACITGSGTGCTGSNLEIEGGGKAYLFLPSVHQAFVGTKADCSNATELQGNVGGDGSFMFAGHHALSETDLIIQGKVTFDKSFFSTLTPLVPLGIKKATIMAVSANLEHYGIGTFATVTAVTPADLSDCP